MLKAHTALILSPNINRAQLI